MRPLLLCPPTLLAAFVLLTAACSSEDPGALDSSDSPAPASTDSTQPAPGPSSSSTSAPDGSHTSPPACTHAITTTTTTLAASPSGPIYVAPTATGGTVIAWSAAGSVHLTRVNASGVPSGADVTVPGDGVHGLAETPTGAAVLVARAPDVLAFVKVGTAGQITSTPLTGNSNHATVDSEWFDFQPEFFADAGRLAWDGTHFVAYFPIFRHWPDGISHTGDTLRMLNADGSNAGGGWSWGCSHSLDVRLAPDGTSPAPVCLSDCYPQKGVMFAMSQLVSSEPSGDCSGRSGAELGGLTRSAGALWLTYASKEGGRSARDIALTKLGPNGAVLAKTWLTATPGDESAVHLAAFEKGLLVGWHAGTKSFVQRLDGNGAPLAAPEETSAALRDHDDFVAWPNGDVGWPSVASTTLTLARYRACP